MNTTNTYDDDYLNELAEGLIDEQPQLRNFNNSSSTTDQSPKDDLDHDVNAESCVKMTQNEPNASNEFKSMEIIDGKHVLSPLTPRKTAEIFILEKYTKNGVRCLQCSPLKGEFYRWVENRYQFVSDFQLKSEIGRFLDHSLQKKKDEIGKEVIVNFTTSSSKETEVLSSVKNYCLEGILQDPGMGASWIHDTDDRPDASMMIPFKNHLLSIGGFIKDGDPFKCLSNLTPQFFDITQIPFNIDPDDCGRKRPIKFIKFLETLFNEDFDNDENCQSIKFLQQWFGYCLTNMNWAQKMLLIVGPPRSGKGTLAKVLQAMLGSSNVTNPSAASLTERFPLEAWPNKKLAIFGDARFSDKKETVKEFLLRISGGDEVNIERKSIASLTNVSLPTKIMILSNDVPTIRDPSSALSSRFITLHLTKTFLGSEKPHLFEEELKPEIPLIFWWALEGLKKLMHEGKFTQPSCGESINQQMKRYESPIKAFIDEFCELRDTATVTKTMLHNGYSNWCEEEGCKPLNKDHFIRNILNMNLPIIEHQPTVNGKQVRSLAGITLNNH